MNIQQNISLKSYNTFGIDVSAKHFASVNTINELQNILKLKGYPNKFILGGGSNMLLTKNIESLVLHINLKGIKTVSKTDSTVSVEANAGENWHKFVLWCIDNNYGGVENLSLIPGNVGTAPIQNIGAYGVELKDVFQSCEVLDIHSGEIRTFTKEDCQFDYRNSVFKNDLKGQYIILSVTFKLSTQHHNIKTEYGAIKNELERNNITKPTIKDVSNAVIAIRSSKLPDPSKIGNSGSFFKNPIISKKQFDLLKQNFPNIPNYNVSNKLVKVPAGWLIEHAGFKGKTFDNYGVHKNQALVLVNYGNAKGTDILNLSKLIQKTIKRIFNINLEAEVNIF
ncbi:UDP-N-acetylmuramate dehydrogenase [Pontimicrobium aquaticum]|uniref:UDP-N-acetylenolpyruvoylglucosamine reductase n=1 Tax=Pontimicrobium aquaticum TaxID=2565367 RepID=A0A4U0EZ43_9FLAO|nr:UDP-N-acetylmuramate dehydrogenase [Pontimicrobium aquaticum]TJY37327.1 UDP-N-acetylmuramate dehydrogenase [Pontimicrobium aquaticum]